MGAQQEEPDWRGVILRAIGAIGAALVAVGMIFFISYCTRGLWRVAKSKDPEYTVAITGAAGLDDLAAGHRPTLSPVFNLTVHINNAGNKIKRECLGRFSMAVVSYGDAFLAKGSVPPFCAEEEQESERGATAWGLDVVVPQFLRERLAGELERGKGEVDVQVTTPDGKYDVVFVCKTEIGGGPSPCWKDYVFAHPAPAAGSTGLASTIHS